MDKKTDFNVEVYTNGDVEIDFNGTNTEDIELAILMLMTIVQDDYGMSKVEVLQHFSDMFYEHYYDINDSLLN